MSKQEKETNNDPLSPEQVREFLVAEPAFFEEYPELLEQANIQAAGEGVSSLTLRQLSNLRDKNAKLQQQLDTLLNIARENDALFGRIQHLTTALIDANSVEDVFATLDDTLRECFGADFFAIRLIGEQEFPISDVVWQADSPELEHFKTVLGSEKIKCGHPTHSQAEVLFSDKAAEVLSTAFIPFMLGKQKGLLAIGSKEEKRFHPSMGTIFLSHLGELVGKRLYSLQDNKAEK